MSLEEKVAKLSRIINVEDQLCEPKTQIKYQKAVLSAEKYAFEKLKTQRILLVAKALRNLIKI